MRCEEIRKEALDYLDGILAPLVRDAFEEHLRSCPSCREELKELRLAWDILDLYAPFPPSEGFVP